MNYIFDLLCAYAGLKLLAFSLTFPAHRRTFPYLILIFLICSRAMTPLEINSSSLLRDPVLFVPVRPFKLISLNVSASHFKEELTDLFIAYHMLYTLKLELN